jgi:hypothetical protein
VVYNFRNPPDSGIPAPRVYAEIVEQVAWLVTLALDLVRFTEEQRRLERPPPARAPRARLLLPSTFPPPRRYTPAGAAGTARMIGLRAATAPRRVTGMLRRRTLPRQPARGARGARARLGLRR